MTTWILIYVVYASGIGTSAANESVSVSAGSVVFHSQISCEAATAHFHKAFCLEDNPNADKVKPSEAK